MKISWIWSLSALIYSSTFLKIFYRYENWYSIDFFKIPCVKKDEIIGNWIILHSITESAQWLADDGRHVVKGLQFSKCVKVGDI